MKTTLRHHRLSRRSDCPNSAPTRRANAWRERGAAGKTLTWVRILMFIHTRPSSLGVSYCGVPCCCDGDLCRIDDPQVPSIPVLLSLVKLFLELSLFNPALLTLQGIMASDDQEVEAWCLEGWAFISWPSSLTTHQMGNWKARAWLGKTLQRMQGTVWRLAEISVF